MASPAPLGIKSVQPGGNQAGGNQESRIGKHQSIAELRGRKVEQVQNFEDVAKMLNGIFCEQDKGRGLDIGTNATLRGDDMSRMVRTDMLILCPNANSDIHDTPYINNVYRLFATAINGGNCNSEQSMFSVQQYDPIPEPGSFSKLNLALQQEINDLKDLLDQQPEDEKIPSQLRQKQQKHSDLCNIWLSDASLFGEVLNKVYPQAGKRKDLSALIGRITLRVGDQWIDTTRHLIVFPKTQTVQEVLQQKTQTVVIIHPGNHKVMQLIPELNRRFAECRSADDESIDSALSTFSYYLSHSYLYPRMDRLVAGILNEERGQKAHVHENIYKEALSLDLNAFVRKFPDIIAPPEGGQLPPDEEKS